ncbi:MAG: hypothetical protein ABI716_01870 [Candidatus Saccharibacteria bacterium]
MKITLRFNKLIDKIFRNKQGKLVVWQAANAPLWGWGISTVLAMLIGPGKIHDGFQLLAQAFLFVWAYLELRHGDSLFRKFLGSVIFIVIIVSLFS